MVWLTISYWFKKKQLTLVLFLLGDLWNLMIMSNDPYLIKIYEIFYHRHISNHVFVWQFTNCLWFWTTYPRSPRQLFFFLFWLLLSFSLFPVFLLSFSLFPVPTKKMSKHSFSETLSFSAFSDHSLVIRGHSDQLTKNHVIFSWFHSYSHSARNLLLFKKGLW